MPWVLSRHLRLWDHNITNNRSRVWVRSFPCGCTLVYPNFPNAYPMQCMLKSNIYFNSQGCEQDQKNKFRTEEPIGSLIGTRFSDHKTGWITTSINNALRTLLLNGMFNPGITSMRVFRITKQHMELQCRLAATTRFLVQLTAKVNQKRLWFTRVPYKHYTLTT
jgi:hypothetical protein